MGIINLTPDSFSSDGFGMDSGAAVAAAESMVAAGATLIDIGGESTRPGASPVTPDEEASRVLPVLRALVARGLRVSVDTSTPSLMRAAAAEGAAMINDVRALRRPGALSAAASGQCAVCLMHMQGDPKGMQTAPAYDNVVTEVKAFLQDRVQTCLDAGIAPERLVVDPGFGFGKSLQHNLRLLNELGELTQLGYPVLVGLSRKSILGLLTGREVGERTSGSAVLAALAVERGAAIVRAHDVAATRDAISIAVALKP